MRTHGAVVGRRFRSVTKLTTEVRIGRGYLWGSFLIAAAALKTPTRNGHNAQGVNVKSFHSSGIVGFVNHHGHFGFAPADTNKKRFGLKVPPCRMFRPRVGSF